MAAARFEQPDVLVLGGGGILGEAWMTALLAGLERAAGIDCTACECFVGTSAGSIVAAALAAGEHPRASASGLPEQPGGGRAAAPFAAPSRALRLAAAPLASIGLSSARAGGALLRRAALARVPRGRRSLGDLAERIDARGVVFDGRLLVTAVELASGRRVLFGGEGAPATSVGTAVAASCAIPGYFRPVTIAGADFVDGGAWSPTNLDAAPAAWGTRVLCLNPTGSLRPSHTGPLSLLAPLSRAVAGVEALALERRGAHVTTVSPSAEARAAMGANLMNPRRRDQVAQAGFIQGVRLG